MISNELNRRCPLSVSRRLTLPGRIVVSTAAALLLIVSTADAQERPAEGADQPSTDTRRDESLIRWQYFAELPLQPAAESPWYDCLLTPAVFDGARFDLADLRLYDAEDQEVPYALRVRNDESQLAVIEADVFNRLEQSGGARQLSLDLGEDDVQHNEVEVVTSGLNYRRKVVVEGSDDGDKWQQIASGFVVHFRRNDREFKAATIDYSASRFRYLRVTVDPDPQQDSADSWELQTVDARHHVEIPGEHVIRDVPFGQREAVRTRRGPGSQWLIELGGASVPVRALVATIGSNDFVRDWQVEAAASDRPGEDFDFVASGTWQRKAGEQPDIFVAEFPHEVRAARLKLLVTDYRNPPLEITAMQTRAAARQIVFSAERPSLPGPLRLYFGNPDAESPRYDFARNLANRLEPPPTRLKPDERLTNPVFQPKPKPLTERLPWLVQCVLGAAVLVLAAIIVSLGQAALKHDERVGAGVP